MAKEKEPPKDRLNRYKPIQMNLKAIETGVLGFDMAIGWQDLDGVVGIREKDIWELMGYPGSGKNAFAEQLTITTLKKYGPGSVVWLFAEPYEISRFEDRKINLEDVIAISCFDSEETLSEDENLAEHKLNLVLKYVEDPNVKVVIIDSIAMLDTACGLYEKKSKSKTAKSTYRELDENPVAALARVYNNFIRQFMKRTKGAILFELNHFKDQINTDYGYVDPNVHSPGGRLKEFMCWGRGVLRSGLQKDKTGTHSVEDNKSSRKITGKLELIRNKYCNPTNNRVVSFEYDINTFRFNNEEKMIEYASFFGARIDDPEKKGKKITVSEIDPPVASSGAFYYIGNEMFQGIDKAVQYLIDNPDIYDKIKYQLYDRRDRFFSDNKPTTQELLDSVPIGVDDDNKTQD